MGLLRDSHDHSLACTTQNNNAGKAVMANLPQQEQGEARAMSGPRDTARTGGG